MLKRKKRSGVVFVSSIIASAPLPCLATYAATKAFSVHFSGSLASEISDKVDVLTYLPNMVATSRNSSTSSKITEK